MTPRSIILRGVKQIWSQNFFAKIQNVTLLSIIRIHIYFCDTIPLRDSTKVEMTGLHLELYCGETDSAQYEIRISQRYFNRNRKYVKPLLSVPGRLEWWILTGGKTCWTVPFLNKIRKEPIQLPPRSMILRGDWLSSQYSMVPRKNSNHSFKS